MARLNLTVDEDIPDLMAELAGSERKRGEYLNKIIRQLHAGQIEASARGSDLEALRYQLAAIIGKQQEDDGRIQRLEATVAKLIAQEA